jgi:tRNA dimethylallyltransferase
MGPTASGKTCVAAHLATRFPIEIVSVDSAQVYRHMDIGTAKPDAALLRRVPHHLIDILDPTERYSAGQFRADAAALVRAIGARGRIPLFVGGTMLYFKALREGLSPLPRADGALRARIDLAAREQGWPALHAELARFDPQAAARIQPNDAQRVQRALEVYYLTGEPMSRLLARGPAAALGDAMLAVALEPSERARLHDRIGQRFDAMLERGLVEEVVGLRSRFALTADLPSMRAVGYRQVWRYLEGELPRTQLRAGAVPASRQLAKRQLTWLRGMAGVARFDCLAADLCARIEHHLAAACDSR